MLTPSFIINQDYSTITVEIQTPHASISSAEFYINNDVFQFYCKPYFLRLYLSGKIVENGSESATYNADSCSFIVKVPKLTPGEEFQGLEMITKLLTPVGKVSAGLPEISDICDEDVTDELSCGDWPLHADLPEELPDSTKYGFANLKSGIFSKLRDEFSTVTDIKNPDSTPLDVRKSKRVQQENEKFDKEHYMYDLEEELDIHEVMEFSPSIFSDAATSFTNSEQHQLKSLPRKQYLLDSYEQKIALLGLIDIIFAWAYNHRITLGENNVESYWNVCKLSSTLSWFDTFLSIHAVCVACYRRSLCFPLHRNWNLSTKVLEDVQRIFSLGSNKVLLKCLLEVHKFLSCDQYYILNDLYMTDYCIWVQHLNKETIKRISDLLYKDTVTKSDVDFELDSIEKANFNCSDNEDVLEELKRTVCLKIVEISDSDDDSSCAYSGDERSESTRS